MNPHLDGPMATLRSRMVATLARWLGDPDLAEDIYQEACLKILENGVSSRPESIVPWLRAVVRSTAIDRLRRERSEVRRRARLAELATEVPGEQGPDEHAVVCQCVTLLLERLPAPLAEVVRLVDIEGGGTNDVARRLAITPTNVRVRLHRARAALTKALRHTCGPCADQGCKDCICRPPRKDRNACNPAFVSSRSAEFSRFEGARCPNPFHHAGSSS